jgi:signal transduction histidine kinase
MTDLAADAQTQLDRDAERAARMETVYRQVPVTVAAGMANALLCAAVLLPVVASSNLMLWLAALGLVSLLRLGLWRSFMRAGMQRDQPRWEHYSLLGALASGLLWGLMSSALLPYQQPYPVFVAFIVGGMCAGAATFNAPHLPTVAAFVFPSVVPLAVCLGLRGTRFDSAMAAMSAIFAVSLLITAVRFGRFFGQSVRTRLDLARQTEALAAANARLRAEIDEREATEAALRHAQKMEAVGNLTAGVAHDFNNVLMAISGSAELLRDQLSDLKQDDTLLNGIFSATQRGARLTRHLLAFARKEALDPSLLDLNAVLRAICPLLEAAIGRAIRVELKLRDGLWPVFVDRNEIERAIINLSINARDAMPRGGTLTLSTGNVIQPPPLPDGRLDFPCVLLQVRDTGTGMSAAVQERAFDPFFTTKPAGSGSGLGLSQVYGLVKQSGGATGIDSAEGAGTAVNLYLPKAAGALPGQGRTAPATAAPRPVRQSGQGTVVVVDDETFVLDVVAGMLHRSGYRPVCCGTGAEALSAIAADPGVIALIADLGLPDGRGDEVARRARLDRPALPVVFITGYNETAPLTGEPWQLRKPFTEAELLAMLLGATGR